jgi:hypothetical protein
MTSSKQGLSGDQLSNFAQLVATDFQKNVGKRQLERRPSPMGLPREMETQNYLGAPAFAMLGYGGGNYAPLRSKAFSMQVHDPTFRSEEKCSPP